MLTRDWFRALVLAALLLGLVALPRLANADGFDSPNMMAARHVAMGTTGIGSVDDPSAVAMNPAGLAGTEVAGFIANVAVLFAEVTGSPTFDGQSTTTESKVAPLPLLAASVRVNDWLVFGLGTFATAAGGGTYSYANPAGASETNSMQIVFWEISPAFAIEIPDTGVRLGAAWRITMTSLTRKQQAAGLPALADFSTFGTSWTGLRLGAQFLIKDFLEIGVAYRHRLDAETADENGTILGTKGRVTADFVLPALLGFGARADLGPVGLATDLVLGFHSQSDEDKVALTPPGGVAPIDLSNTKKWRDAITVKAGLEYRATDALALRAGYIWDQNATNAAYPSPWGSPPKSDTHSLSLGAGWDAGSWALNLAWSNRFGTGTSTVEDKTGGKPCVPCGFTGDYGLSVNGVYADFSWAWGADGQDSPDERELEMVAATR